MFSVEECQIRARRLIEEAKAASGPEKLKLLKLAESWIVMAEQMGASHGVPVPPRGRH